MSLAYDPSMPAPQRTPLIAAGIIGFALGGFFDGILLHQVLQWHHFLSLVEGERYRDIRVQILADGMFHVAVYIVAALGLWLLWRRGQARPADRVLLAYALIGFGIWQFADVVLIHWVTGIHRIRVGVPNPLLWDIGWLIVFGVPALLAGWLLLQKGAQPPSGASRSRGTASIALSLLVLLAAPIAALPSADTATVVMFRPGTGAANAFAAASAINANVVWSDPTGEVLLMEVPRGADSWTLYRHGALLVGNAGPLAGCLAWTRV